MRYNPRTALISAFYSLLALAVFAPVATADDAHPHGHDCTTSIQINLNQDEKVVFKDSRDLAVYRIVLDRRGLIDIWTDPGSFDVWGMDLLNASCEPVPGVSAGMSIINGVYSKITVPTFQVMSDEDVFGLDPGVYYVRMNPDPGRVSKDVFTVHNKFTPHVGHDCETAEPIALSGAAQGALLYAKDKQVFRIKTEKAGRIYAWTTGRFTPSRAPEVGLLRGDCTSAFEQMYRDDRGIGITAPLLGPDTYYIAVQPFDLNSLGAFALNLEFEAVLE